MDWAEITKQNPWWKFEDVPANFQHYDRDLKEAGARDIVRKTTTFEKNSIYVVRGPRRVGKTVWMKQTILNLFNIPIPKINARDIFYLDCETITSGSRIELDNTLQNYFRTSRGSQHTFIFLDEVNYITDWESELKTLYDTGKIINTTIIATGSNASMIRKGTSHLSGRRGKGIDLIMRPLSFRQFIINVLRTNASDWGANNLNKIGGQDNTLRVNLSMLSAAVEKINFTLEDPLEKIEDQIGELHKWTEELNIMFSIYLITGGFPMAIKSYFNDENNLKTRQIDENKYRAVIDYIQKDISEVGLDYKLTKQVLKTATENLATKLTYAAFGRNTEEGIPHSTVISHIRSLEDTFAVRTLNAYDFIKRDEKSKGLKKIYFTDPFVFHAARAALSGQGGFISAKESIENEELCGKIVESIVHSHLEASGEVPIMRDPSTFLWFYYTLTGKELDFIYKRKDEKYLGIEVKYQNQIKPADLSMPKEISDGFILTKNHLDIDNRMVPVGVFLAGLEKTENNL